MAKLLTASEAAKRLGVSRQTLYAYVSRGLVRSYGAEAPRERRYLAEAIDRLAVERRRGRRPKEVAKATLHWGPPVIESAIATVDGGRLIYRGKDAVALAATASLEETAALLWQAPAALAFPDHAPAFAAAAMERTAHDLLADFATATDDEATAIWRPAEALAVGCGVLLRTMAALVVDSPAPSAAAIHIQVAQAFALDARGAELIRAALVLSADHELNASSFTARVVASTGASVRAAIIAGLAALTGPRHGGATARVEAFFDTVGSGDPNAVLRERLAVGEDAPGFGHPLYPNGDPRAAAILAWLRDAAPHALVIAAAQERLTGRPPMLDFALVALRRALGLPRGAAFGLFALGRTVGWIAHALEQRQRQSVIRPRAAYVGPRPASG
jgi:citrate synthase